jgi:hypothetical protein
MTNIMTERKMVKNKNYYPNEPDLGLLIFATGCTVMCSKDVYLLNLEPDKKEREIKHLFYHLFHKNARKLVSL